MLKGPIAILIANTTIQELVGLNEAGDKYKVYPVIAPQGEKAPYITLAVAGGARSSKELNCGRQLQFVVSSVASSYDDVTELDEAVITAFDEASAGTYEDVVVSFINDVNLSADEYNLDHKLYGKKSTFVCQLDG